MTNIIEAIEAKLQEQKDAIFFKDLQINELKEKLSAAEKEIALLEKELSKGEGENNDK